MLVSAPTEALMFPLLKPCSVKRRSWIRRSNPSRTNTQALTYLLYLPYSCVQGSRYLVSNAYQVLVLQMSITTTIIIMPMTVYTLGA